jgi:D-alanine-D-alanine ligase-like ATP-grasp enzyme
VQIKFKIYSGYIYGALQPSISVSFRGKFQNTISQRIDFLHSELLREKNQAKIIQSPQSSFDLLTNIILIISNICGDLNFTPITSLYENNKQTHIIPTLSPKLIINNTKILLKIIQRPVSSRNTINYLTSECSSSSRSLLPAGSNNGNFLAAAAKINIPFKIFTLNHIIFGYGTQSYIFYSSIIENESSIGVSLAKNKELTSRLLSLSGIPVAPQESATSIENCLNFSEKHGYPVVLKPISEDQGRGVIANIKNRDELEDSFEELSGGFKNLIIEKHLPGRVYRINTHGEFVFRAVHRQHPAVVGDGNLTIQELIEAENKDPLRNSIHASRQKIKINTETLRTLKHQGLNLSSIPNIGQSVILSYGLSGGISVDALDQIHPENLNICIQAAQTMRVNLSGVDFISQDPSQPWFNNGGFICEVNAQPELSTTHPEVYKNILCNYVKDTPDIHVAVSNMYEFEKPSLFNKLSDKIHIKVCPKYLMENGCPSQYYDSITFSDDIPEDDRRKILSMLASKKPVF